MRMLDNSLVAQQPSASPTSKERAEIPEIRPLTGVRALAALWVVFLHFQPEWALLLPGLAVGDAFCIRGRLGVDVFFILSGFILSYVYLSANPELTWSRYRKFLVLRVARIYPVHVVTFAMLALLVLGARLLHLRVEGEYSLFKVPFELTMTHVWWPFLKRGGWNYPSWSISAEWFAYLFVFPAAAWILRRGWKTPGLLLTGYAALTIWLVMLSQGAEERCLPRVICEFLAGAMIYGIYRRNPAFTNSCQRLTTVLAVAVIAIAALVPAERFYPMWTTVLLFPLMLLGLTSESSWAGRFLASPLAVWGGRISYSLYMVQALVQKLVKVGLPTGKFVASPWPVRCGVVLLELAVLIGAAAALYYLVEEPARHWIRRLSSRRPRGSGDPARQ